MNFSFILYVLMIIVLVLGSFYFNYVRGKMIQATLLSIGFLLVGIIFGTRWFTGSGEINSDKPPTTWPPNINSCPDYLTLYKRPTGYVCIDNIGVSNGGISKWSDATQTDAKYIFDLFTTDNSASRIQKLCDQSATKKVTWEGVWDGTTCLQREPPLPL
jgi:hypothetical protein